MNSFAFTYEEVGNPWFLKYKQAPEEKQSEEQPGLPEIRGTKDGRLSFKSERICQTIVSNPRETFRISKLSKRRKKKTVFFTVDPVYNQVHSQNIFSCANHPHQD